MGCNVRYFSSKAALILLLWDVTIMCTLTMPNFLSPYLSSSDTNSMIWIEMVATSASYMLYLIPGLMADLWCGRYRLMIASIVIVWCGVLVLTLSAAFLSISHKGTFFIQIVAIAFIYIGKAGFQVNVIQFGCDHLVDAPSSQLNSFVSWCVWSESVGYGLGFCLSYILLQIQSEQSPLVISGMVVSVSFCILLTANFCWTKKWFHTEAEVKPVNPYGTVFKVLRYAWKHKFPERRSALTYWEEGLPSRIDLGKSKYGGPFTVEQVEDVKTLGRILLVLASALIPLIGFTAEFLGEFFTFFHLGFYNTMFTEYALKTGQIKMAFVVLLVPTYEILLLPVLKRYTPTSLMSLCVAILLISLSMILNLTLDVIGHRISEHEVPCFFNQSMLKVNGSTLDLNSWTILLPVIPQSLGYVIGYISVLKFLVAQSPQHMKGMLIGLFYSLWGLGGFMGFMIVLPFSNFYPQVTSPSGLSCGSAYYLLCTAIGAVGLLGYAVAIRRYKYRKRDEPLGNEQQFAIRYYEQSLHFVDNTV